jgi:hypothetical protein
MKLFMTRATLVASALTIAFGAADLSAQAKPDFAGKWVLEPAAAAAPAAGAPAGGGRGGRGGGLGQALTVTQDATTLTLDYTAGGPTPTPVKLVYKLDGSPNSNSVPARGEMVVQTSKAAWEGSTLVITTTTANGEQKRVFALDGGNLKVTTTNPGNPNFGDGQPTTTTATYKKG